MPKSDPPIRTAPITALHPLRRVLFAAAVLVCLVFVAVVATLRYAILPNIERYRPDIVQKMAAATGMAVAAGELRGGWEGLRPYVELKDVSFSDPAVPAAPGTRAFSLSSLRASLSWWSLLFGDVRLHEVVLEQPELSLRRGADGKIYFAGKPLDDKSEGQGQVIPWLLQQPQLAVHDAVLVWRDELTGAPELRLAHVGIRIEKSGSQHRFGVVATPQGGSAAALDLRGAVRVAQDDKRWLVSGVVYGAATQASVAGLRRHITIPDTMRDATGNVRAWVEFDMADARPVRSVTADVNLVNASAQFASELAPLTLANLSGRIDYHAEPGGFGITSKGLNFRTREGVALPPADFSLLSIAEPGKPVRGEATANGADLKVMAALLPYFPVGKDVRESVAHFAPRGKLTQTALSWSGDLGRITAWRVKSAFAEFAMNSGEKAPGVSGLTGTVEGDERGGKFHVDSHNARFEIERVFRGPLQFDTLAADGSWTKNGADLGIDIANFAFANADGAGAISGTYHTGGKGPGIVAFQGKISHAVATKVADYLPNSAQHTRDWLDRAIQAGKLTEGSFEIKGDLWEFPFKDDTHGKLRINVHTEGVRLRFRDEWPALDDINGDIAFAGAKISVAGNSAAIYNARVGPTRVEIDDTTSWTPLLTLQGTVNAPAQDVSRYLQNSPLVDGVGRFTQVVALEGAGKLDLSLAIPLGSAEAAAAQGKVRPPLKVSGRYQIFNGRAQPPVGAAVTGVNGAVMFTEKTVKSQNLAGVVYNNPLQVTISGGGEEGVVTELAGRADVTALNDVLPFRLPPQVTGTTDWRGRITAKYGRTDLAFDSDLIGVASALPSPLEKTAAQPMKVSVAFSEVGQPSERIDVALGSVAFGRFARKFNAKGVAAGFAGGVVSLEKPVAVATLPEGLWLMGDLRELDIDHWKDTFHWTAGGSSTAAAAPDSGGSVFSGFDLTVKKALAFGREFKEMRLKGRRAEEDWRVTIESAELTGDALWRPTADNGRGHIRARLANFVLNEQPAPAAGAPPAIQPAATAVDLATAGDFPTLDVVADKFRFRGYDLGKLELQASTQGKDWRIDKLLIIADGSTFDSSGRWSMAGGRSRSEFSVKVDSNNLNGLMRTFGHAELMRRGTGELDGTLSWPGYPYEFAVNNLSGEFRLEARKGEFARIEPGAGRLLGLLSLQSIPRRITFDFRDIFSEGFAFDRISGRVKIDHGILRTDNLEIAGTSAFVTMAGEVSLPEETQNLKLTVVPQLGGGVSLLTGFLGGPVVGLTSLVVQKLLQDPVGKAAAYQYSVTGKWDNPDVVKLSRNVPPGEDPKAPDAKTAVPAQAGAEPANNASTKNTGAATPGEK